MHQVYWITLWPHVNPFEPNSGDHHFTMIDIKYHDMNFYNGIDSHIALNCNYYFEESISAAIKDKINLDWDSYYSFFLCDMSISEASRITYQLLRSVSKMWISNSRQFVFPKLGFVTAIVVCIILRYFVEAHMPSKIDGRVGILIRNDISFQIKMI